MNDDAMMRRLWRVHVEANTWASWLAWAREAIRQGNRAADRFLFYVRRYEIRHLRWLRVGEWSQALHGVQFLTTRLEHAARADFERAHQAWRSLRQRGEDPPRSSRQDPHYSFLENAESRYANRGINRKRDRKLRADDRAAREVHQALLTSTAATARAFQCAERGCGAMWNGDRPLGHGVEGWFRTADLGVTLCPSHSHDLPGIMKCRRAGCSTSVYRTRYCDPCGTTAVR